MAASHSTHPTGALGALFKEAGEVWLDSRRPYITGVTARNYEKHLAKLASFFGTMRLPEISSDMIRAYQRMRLATASASYINKELSALQQMLKRIGVWDQIDYQTLPIPREEQEGPGHALSADEERCYFGAAFANPALAVGAHCLRLLRNTSMGPGELRSLRLCDVELEPTDGMRPRLSVPPRGAKNPARVRLIPLNAEALEDARWLWERVRKLGAIQPDNFLVPFCVHRNCYDVTRAASPYYLQKTNRGLCALLGMRVRSYDMRHTAISLLLANPRVSLMESRAIAGHISNKMQRRYFHEDQRRLGMAVDGLLRAPAKPAVKKSVRSVPGQRAATGTTS